MLEEQPHSQGPVFVLEGGRPCHIFVEATAVRERPKLIRRISRSGGLVVNTAREADVVLAENHTKEALELLDAWGVDKVVLSTRWVPACLQAGRFLGEDTAWAGLRFDKQVLRQGIQFQEEDNSEEDETEVETQMK